MVSLDDYLRQNPGPEPPYFLKVDIDGHEMKVLHGAAETLKQTSVVMIEAQGGALVERVGYLIDVGFRLFDLTRAVLLRQQPLAVRCGAGPPGYPRRAIFADLNENFDPAKYTTFNPS